MFLAILVLTVNFGSGEFRSQVVLPGTTLVACDQIARSIASTLKAQGLRGSVQCFEISRPASVGVRT